MLEKTKNNNKEKIQRCRSASSSRLIKEFDDFRDEKCALAHLLALSHFSVSIQAQTLMNQAWKVCVFLGGHHDWCCIYYLLLSIILFSLMQIAICLETRNHFSFLFVVEKNFYCIWWDLLKQNCYLSNWHFPIDWHLVKTMDHYGQFW